MKIHGLDGLSNREIQNALQNGGKFVAFQYCISIIILTFRRSSAVYFIPPAMNATLQGLKYSLISFFMGWWGIPWGPIYTIQSLWVNSKGGRDITANMLAALQQSNGPETR